MTEAAKPSDRRNRCQRAFRRCPVWLDLLLTRPALTGVEGKPGRSKKQSGRTVDVSGNCQAALRTACFHAKGTEVRRARRHRCGMRPHMGIRQSPSSRQRVAGYFAPGNRPNSTADRQIRRQPRRSRNWKRTCVRDIDGMPKDVCDGRRQHRPPKPSALSGKRPVAR